MNYLFDVIVDEIQFSQEYVFVKLFVKIGNIVIGSGDFVDKRLMLGQIKTLIHNISYQDYLNVDFIPNEKDFFNENTLSKNYLINGEKLSFYELFSGIPLETEAFDGDKVFLFSHNKNKNLYFKEFGNKTFLAVYVDVSDFLGKWRKVEKYLKAI